jgi:phosphoribosylaminoimidazole-succinocarboxamide synthase
MSELPLRHSGKIRDVYSDGPDLILVTSDRISVYDVVLPTPIPDKGKILTRLSLWWFDQLRDIVPHHVISTDVPSEWAGRAVRVRPLKMIAVECIARGYLAGLGLAQYQAGGVISGVPVPAGLVEGSKLPEPIFTPTTKAPENVHDEPMAFSDVAAREGEDVADELRRITLEIYRRGAAIAKEAGVIVADTKLEFGWNDKALTLGDEVLTSDSSRFWLVEEWSPGRPQRALDKQFVRDWAAGTGWDRRPPAPEIPEEVVAATRARYVDAYERITGERW